MTLFKNKKVMNQTIWATAALALTAVGCKQNPYPTEGHGQVTKEKLIELPEANSNVVEVASRVDCDEGTECVIPIVGHVPAGKTPMLQLTGLPTGAVYDEAHNKITYTPSFDVVDISDRRDSGRERDGNHGKFDGCADGQREKR